MEKKKVNIPLYCVADFISKYWNDNQHKYLVENITSEAIKAWEQRPAEAKTVRFICQMPSKTGIHFRFFEAKKDNQGVLQISV